MMERINLPRSGLLEQCTPPDRCSAGLPAAGGRSTAAGELSRYDPNMKKRT